MWIDEERRLALADAAKQALGHDAGVTLMALLPPVGWADVVTKHDLAAVEQRFDARLDALELRLEARFERGFRQVLTTVSALLVSGFAATIITGFVQ